jgi:hypothetical protein
MAGYAPRSFTPSPSRVSGLAELLRPASPDRSPDCANEPERRSILHERGQESRLRLASPWSAAGVTAARTLFSYPAQALRRTAFVYNSTVSLHLRDRSAVFRRTMSNHGVLGSRFPNS